jgi:hypothetical protein
MSRRRPAIALALATAAVLSIPVTASGQNAPPVFQPGLGDLMTMMVQPRHLKVGLAGQERNWAYLAYELHELEESLEKVAKLVPKWREIDIAGLIKGTIMPPIEALEEAAKTKDAVRFNEAYARLTAACNACHQSTKVGMIVVQVPRGSSPFTNQDFRPAKP